MMLGNADWRGIRWSFAVWLMVLAVAATDLLLGDGAPDGWWVAAGLAAIFLIGVHAGGAWWQRGALWTLSPLAAWVVWQIVVVLTKDPRQSPDIGVETGIVLVVLPIVLGVGALLVWAVAWLGVTLGNGD